MPNNIKLNIALQSAWNNHKTPDALFMPAIPGTVRVATGTYATHVKHLGKEFNAY